MSIWVIVFLLFLAHESKVNPKVLPGWDFDNIMWPTYSHSLSISNVIICLPVWSLCWTALCQVGHMSEIVLILGQLQSLCFEFEKHYHLYLEPICFCLFSYNSFHNVIFSIIFLWTLPRCQICQLCPSVPQVTWLESGGFLNFTKIIGCPHAAIVMRQPQLCCLNDAATIRLPLWLLFYLK